MILKTKLYPPQARVELISRPRLIELFNQGVAKRLTLVSAPAGYGKSTLLGAWIRQAEVPVGWVSLDETDQDLVRFLTYFIAALQENEIYMADTLRLLGRLEEALSAYLSGYRYLQQAEALARKYNLEKERRQITKEIASLDFKPDTTRQTQTVIPPAAAQRSRLIEPLTERELNILRMLNTDLTGPEIAQELYVALSTVRFHTKNIYAKLGVSNRMAAVNQAKEFGLL